MLVLVEAKGTTDPVLAGQGLAGAVHGKEQVGSPAAGVTKAGVKVGDRAVEEIAEKGRPDGAAALRKGGLSDRSPAEVAKEVVEFDGSGLADELQDKGYGAPKGQRTVPDEVPVRLIDVLRALLLSEVGEAAQERKKAGQGVGHSPKIRSRLMP